MAENASPEEDKTNAPVTPPYSTVQSSPQKSPSFSTFDQIDLNESQERNANALDSPYQHQNYTHEPEEYSDLRNQQCPLQSVPNIGNHSHTPVIVYEQEDPLTALQRQQAQVHNGHQFVPNGSTIQQSIPLPALQSSNFQTNQPMVSVLATTPSPTAVAIPAIIINNAIPATMNGIAGNNQPAIMEPMTVPITLTTPTANGSQVS